MQIFKVTPIKLKEYIFVPPHKIICNNPLLKRLQLLITQNKGMNENHMKSTNICLIKFSDSVCRLCIEIQEINKTIFGG